MNLPYPFDNASGVKANPEGAIDLIDDQGKALARLPLITAFELSPKSEGHGDGYGFRNGGGFGSSFGSGYGYGQSYGQTDGSGRGNSK